MASCKVKMCTLFRKKMVKLFQSNYTCLLASFHPMILQRIIEKGDDTNKEHFLCFILQQWPPGNGADLANTAKNENFSPENLSSIVKIFCIFLSFGGPLLDSFKPLFGKYDMVSCSSWFYPLCLNNSK